MGLAYLDLIFRIEREFDIKLERNDILNILYTGKTHSSRTEVQADIRVSEFVKLVEKNISRQCAKPHSHVFERVSHQIVECLGVDESEVSRNAWLIQDLGLE